MSGERRLNPKLQLALNRYSSTYHCVMEFAASDAEMAQAETALLDVIREMLIEAMRAEIQQTTQLMCGVQVIPRELPDMANAILYPETKDE